MRDCLNQLEKCALKMLTDGDDDVLRIVRTQLAIFAPKKRAMTGAGFYKEFEVRREGERIQGDPSLMIDDVCGNISGLEQGVGFILHIRKGLIEALECFCYAESWPQSIESFDLYYVKRSGDGNLSRIDQRDLSQLRELPGWPQG